MLRSSTSSAHEKIVETKSPMPKRNKQQSAKVTVDDLRSVNLRPTNRQTAKKTALKTPQHAYVDCIKKR